MPQPFEQSNINAMILSNRFVRSATWEGLATDDGACTPRLIELMARLAEGGVGLIITGHAYIRQDGQHSPWQLGIYKDDLIPGLRAMTEAVHEKSGKIAMQLGYGGAYLSKSRIRQMTSEDFQKLVNAYELAAIRAKKAEFDGIQIFAAHGFFLSQLLCPRYNDRTDAYGGDIRNRTRVLLEVVESIRRAVGQNYPILVKLNCQDFVENGLSLEESIQVAAMLETVGIDAIELSGGLLNNPNIMQSKIDPEESEAYFRNEARVFKKTINVPIILVGGIRSYEVAKAIINNGCADYVSMARPFICEPDLIHRWQAGDRREAACISCNNCFEQIMQGKGVACVPVETEPAETFFPHVSKTVPASPKLLPDTDYQISIGLEQWESMFIPVVKIQMVYKGKIISRKPSFPIGTEDYIKVNQTITELLKEYSADTNHT